MRRSRSAEIAGQPGTTFMGPVEMRRLLDFQRADGVNVSLVRLEDGARTNWHIRPGEQIVIVVEGEERVGIATELFPVARGDVVYCAPSEQHWHGAQPGKQMAHFSLTTIGPPTWQEAPEE